MDNTGKTKEEAAEEAATLFGITGEEILEFIEEKGE